MSSHTLLLLLFGFGAAFFALVIVVVLYNVKKEKDRTQQLQLLASQLGWNFAAAAPLSVIDRFYQFALFNQGDNKEIRNFMSGEASGAKAAVFDYAYVVGSGKNRQTHRLSVLYLEPADLNLPYFSLRPETFLYSIISALGYQDIDFAQRPEFSNQYILRGQDEPAIRRAFNDGVLGFYESHPQTCTDGGGNQLFVFRSDYRFQPQEIQSYLRMGLTLLGMLSAY